MAIACYCKEPSHALNPKLDEYTAALKLEAILMYPNQTLSETTSAFDRCALLDQNPHPSSLLKLLEIINSIV